MMGIICSEYYPSSVSPQHLGSRWNEIVRKSDGDVERFEAVVLSGANHKVEDGKAQEELAQRVTGLLQHVIQDTRQVEEENIPSSFEQVVELITNGKADTIPGVKQIPLKVRRRKGLQRGENIGNTILTRIFCIPLL
jgi:hypothetical protein